MSAKKNSGAAAVLSFFVPGLGQIYNGQLGKGITIVIASVISWTIIYVCFFIYIPLWIWSIYDAYKTAENINKENGYQLQSGE